MSIIHVLTKTTDSIVELLYNKVLYRTVVLLNAMVFLPFFLFGKMAGERIRAFVLGEQYVHMSFKSRFDAYFKRHGI